MFKMGNCQQMTSIVIFLDSLILDSGTTPEEKNAVASLVISFCLQFLHFTETSNKCTKTSRYVTI